MPKILTRYYLLLAALMLLSLNSNAQIYREVSTKLKFSGLDSTAKGLHWRLWAPQGWGVLSVIQVDQMTDSSFSGKVMLYTNEAVDVKKELPTGRVFSTSTNMMPSEAELIASYLKQNNINRIPTDSLIYGWKRDMDGAVYTIECIDNQHYLQKQYWTPSAFPNLKEAISIQRLIDTAKSILNLETKKSQFSNQVPFESWSGGMGIVKRNLHWFKRLKYKRERNAYRKRMHIAEKP